MLQKFRMRVDINELLYLVDEAKYLRKLNDRGLFLLIITEQMSKKQKGFTFNLEKFIEVIENRAKPKA